MFKTVLHVVLTLSFAFRSFKETTLSYTSDAITILKRTDKSLLLGFPKY